MSWLYSIAEGKIENLFGVVLSSNWQVTFLPSVREEKRKPARVLESRRENQFGSAAHSMSAPGSVACRNVHLKLILLWGTKCPNTTCLWATGKTPLWDFFITTKPPGGSRPVPLITCFIVYTLYWIRKRLLDNWTAVESDRVVVLAKWTDAWAELKANTTTTINKHHMQY